MRIAIDLSSLQGPHRMRGIGYTLINLINNIPSEARKEHSFVFFLEGDVASADDPLNLLELEGLQYEVRQLGPGSRSNRKLRGKMQMLVSAYNNLLDLKDFYFGDSRFTGLKDIDVFLQTDQSQGLPKKRGVKTALVIYDIIPYVLEWDYMWSYHTARIRGFPPKAALRCHVRRKLYARKLRIKARRADVLLAISERTKKDFVEKLGVKANKILVTPLGVNMPGVTLETPGFMRYTASSWGYSPRPYKLNANTPYILFVGGADSRRRLQDLVVAFNHLRAEGQDLKLVLAGDSMQGPRNISTVDIQNALSDSSYLDDVIFMGFVDDRQRDWLYSNALAFVFPSKYEGFGLPVLEAMIHRCPVIAYENAATREVARDLPVYARDYKGLMEAIKKLAGSSEKDIKRIKDRGYAHAKQYDWQKTAKKVLAGIT